MNRKTIFIILISLSILITGCININLSPQEQQKPVSDIPKPVSSQNKLDTSKLDINKVILNENEMKEIIGQDWTKINIPNRGTPAYIQMIAVQLEKQNTYLKEPPRISLMMYILSNTTSTLEFYNKMQTELFKGSTITDYNIGESGKLLKISNSETTMVLFRINTIIVMSGSSLNQETAINLAKKQEAKINNIIQSMN